MTELVHSPPSPGSSAPKRGDFLHDPHVVARETCEEVSSLYMLSSSGGSPAVQSAAPSSLASPRHDAAQAGGAAPVPKPASRQPSMAMAAVTQSHEGAAADKVAAELCALDDQDRSNSVISCASCAASDYGQAD